MRTLENLEPKKVMHFFEEICNIPHGSGNEQMISDYLKQFAIDRNLEVVQDKGLNIIIKKAGTKGKEYNDAVIIQGHMDMVCEKNIGTEHDFEKDPIKLIVDGDIISADGTTLGADDGVAVAYALAILDSDDIEHPPLEVIITTEEETGMGGAYQLDLSDLKAKYMINIDIDDEGVFLASCAGGAKSTGTLTVTKENTPTNMEGLNLSIRGLKGGHSGIEIDKGLGNSNVIAMRVLADLASEFDIRMFDVDGGAKDNAIPRECDVKIVINSSNFDNAELKVKELETIIKAELEDIDPDLNISLTKIDTPSQVFTEDDTKKIISAILLLPNGITSMSSSMKGLVETSNNVGVIKYKDNKIIITCATRSSVETRKYDLLNKIMLVYKTLGFDGEMFAHYPGWKYTVNSELRDIFAQTYKELYNKDGEVRAVHAGLEVGVVLEQMPHLDVVSIGPNVWDIHTPDERMSISSLERTYKLLLEVLKKL